MNNETTNKTTETPTHSNNTAAQTGGIAVNLLKLAGAAFMTYRAISAAKQHKIQAASPASTNSGINRSSDQPSMASVDKNALLNMALQHMRNMTRITTRY